MGCDRNAVSAVAAYFGFLDELIGIALDGLSGGLAAGAGARQVGGVDEVLQDFVIDLDLTDRVAGEFLGIGGHGGDLGPLPLDLLAGLRDDVDGAHAGRLFGGAGID